MRRPMLRLLSLLSFTSLGAGLLLTGCAVETQTSTDDQTQAQVGTTTTRAGGEGYGAGSMDHGPSEQIRLGTIGQALASSPERPPPQPMTPNPEAPPPPKPEDCP